MIYIILYILLAVLCAWKIHFVTANMDVKIVMNRLNKLRFIFAILIIFTHCTLPYKYLPHILFPLRKISTFGVGYFFILSGYGLAYSVANKPNYLDHFGKKIGNLVWITIFSSVVSALIKNLALGWSEPLSLINWYMPAIIALYIIFYVVFSLLPKSKNIRNACLVGAAFASILIVLYFDNFTGNNYRNYYISELAFPFGVLIYEYADLISRFLKKKSAIFIVIVAEIIFGGIAFSVPERGLLDLIFHNLMLVPVGFVLILLMDKIEINNLILKTMNRYTMFIYLFQFPVLTILKNYYLSNERPFDVFFFFACLGLTCILAVIIQNIYDRVGMIVNKHFHHND
ncbi:acyltransferase family protein [Brotaphodocola sp.]|uniref:acyltransferase family protein n=1 Tax=Brotaphodocola sp. TaxID=3073577 RepID=UPI003D7E7E28